MDGCIFCKIVNKELPSTVVYEDDKVLAFKDINPAAEVHVLIIPKQHVANVKEINEDNGNILIDIHLAANKIAQKLGVSETGFRLITNCGSGAGQTVFHLHYHLLSGREVKANLL